MSSSVTPIELSSVSAVRTDDASLTVTLADGRVISTPLDWFPRLAYATPAERANWRLTGDGEAIHWPDLDEDISVEGLIAGRKSGEGTASLKRWMAVQAQLRQMPSDYRTLRREVVALGPCSAQAIEQRIAMNLGDEGDLREWRVALASDPFIYLKQQGITEQLAVAAFVYQADSLQSAREVKQVCEQRGMTVEPEQPCAGDAYVIVYSKEFGRRWSSADEIAG